jgi:hypothetical protein
MWLHFTNHYHTQTIVFSITVFTALLGNGFQWRMFPFLWVPELFLASATSFCNSQLTCTDCWLSLNSSLDSNSTWTDWLMVKVKVTLRLTVSQSVSLGVEPHLGLMTRYYFRSEYRIRLTVTFFIPWDALSDERTGLSFVCATGLCQRSLSWS